MIIMISLCYSCMLREDVWAMCVGSHYFVPDGNSDVSAIWIDFSINAYVSAWAHQLESFELHCGCNDTRTFCNKCTYKWCNEVDLTHVFLALVFLWLGEIFWPVCNSKFMSGPAVWLMNLKIWTVWVFFTPFNCVLNWWFFIWLMAHFGHRYISKSH